MKNCYELYKKLTLAEEAFQNLQLDSKASTLKFEEQGKNRSMNNPEKTKTRQNLVFAFSVLFTTTIFCLILLNVLFLFSSLQKTKIRFFLVFAFYLLYSFERKNQNL